jgi:uncharacterized RDD family membrane protein YckC
MFNALVLNKMKSNLFIRRFSAFFIDYLIVILPYCLVLFGISVFLNHIFYFHNALSDSKFMFLIPFLFVTLPVTMYFAMCESSHWRSSIGKKLIGLHVDTLNNPPSLKPAFKRNFLKFIPCELGHQIAILTAFDLVSVPYYLPYVLMTLIVIYFIGNTAFYFANNMHQTLYDRWSFQSVTLKS